MMSFFAIRKNASVGIPTNTLRTGGDEENRTPDPLLARQVLSQLSYTPIYWLATVLAAEPLVLLALQKAGRPKWTRTTDLTLIRRAL